MIFNLVSLRADTRYLALGDSTNTQYGDTDLDRNINRWYETGLALAFSANGDWQVNGDYATTSIVATQREYVLPADSLKINEVYIKTTSAGEYVKATQRDLSAVNQYNETYVPLTPEFDLMDNSLFIYLPEGTIVDVADGLKIVYQKDITELTGTLAPNLAEPFKRLLSWGAAFDYCVAKEMYSKAKTVKVMIDELSEKLMAFDATRSTAQDVRLIPAEKNYF